ncbi:MAG: hypothetical protein ABW046_13135, partial [Actinoplanes sp.]
MRPHVYVVTAGSVLLAGCAGDVAAPQEAPPSPVVVATSSPSPSPTVTLREPHSLVLNATGTAAVTSVTYELDGRKTTDKSVSLPWRKVVEVPADGKRHVWSLSLKHRSGKVELVAIFDGTVTGQTRGEIRG